MTVENDDGFSRKPLNITTEKAVKKIIAAVLLFATSAAALAQTNGYGHQRQRSGGYTYDSGSGNSYSSSGRGYQGYNSNTGATWNSQSSGSQTYGTDSRGNSYGYDRNTGIYQNYGTGEMRYRGQRQ